MKRAPVSISIQPQMLAYGVILAGVCGLTYYNERKKDSDELETTVQSTYRGDLRDIRSKNTHMYSRIRGKDDQIEGVMNTLVWNGNAGMPAGRIGKLGPSPQNPNVKAPVVEGEGDESASSSADSDDSSSSDSDDSMDVSAGTPEVSDRKLRKRERKRRRRERRKKRQEEEARRQKEIEELTAARAKSHLQQNVLTAAAVGAIALAAATVLTGSRRQ